MTELFLYTLSALFALLPASFLFRGKMALPLRCAFFSLVLLADELFVYFAFSDGFPLYGILPFRMFAFTLCFSTLFLRKRERFFGILATILWLWVDFFGTLPMSYRGFEVHPFSLFAVALPILPLALLPLKRKEARFAVSVAWAFAWMFSLPRTF